jgi:hypothetical protein
MIVLAPSGRLAQIEPVGRLITGPLEPLQVHKGLLEVDRMLIESCQSVDNLFAIRPRRWEAK